MDDDLRKLQLDDNEMVSYQEFLLATVDHVQYFTESNIASLFEKYDKNNSNTISKDELDFLISPGKWEKLMRELNNNDRNQGLTREEFEESMKYFVQEEDEYQVVDKIIS